MILTPNIMSLIKTEKLRSIFVPGFMDDERQEGILCFTPMYDNVYFNFQTHFLKMTAIGEYDKLQLSVVTKITPDFYLEEDEELCIGDIGGRYLPYDGGNIINQIGIFFNDECKPAEGVVKGMEIYINYGYIFVDPINVNGIQLYKNTHERDLWIEQEKPPHSATWQRKI